MPPACGVTKLSARESVGLNAPLRLRSIVALMRTNYDTGRSACSADHPSAYAGSSPRGRLAVPFECGRYSPKTLTMRSWSDAGHRPSIVDVDSQDFVADQIEEFVTGQRHPHHPDRVLATVMFTDIVGSTQRASESAIRDGAVAQRLVRCAELTAFRGREVNTAGDGLFATFDGPARAIKCARSIRERVRELVFRCGPGYIRANANWYDDDMVGLAVHIGARVAAVAEPDEVLVSSTVKDLVAGVENPVWRSRPAQPQRRACEWRLFAVL